MSQRAGVSNKPDGDRRWVRRMAIHADARQRANLNYRRTYILPTKRGLYYLLTVIIMFTWSVNYGLSLGYAMTFLAIIFGIVLAVMTVNNLMSLESTAIENRSFFAGEPAFFRLRLDTTKVTPAIAITARRNGQSAQPASILAKEHAIIEIPSDDTDRGVKTLSYVRVGTDYPVGVFQSWTWLYFSQEMLIYPQPYGDLPLPALPRHHGDNEENSDARGAQDFADVREYQAGDNLRHVLWKRMINDKVRVKTFHDQSSMECILDFNDVALTHLGVEARLSQLCAWVLQAERQGIPYALRLPYQRVTLGLGTKHQSACLEALACF